MLQGNFGDVNSLLIWKYIAVLKRSKLLRSCWIGWQTVLHTVSEARSLVCDKVIFFEFPEHKHLKKVKILCLSQIDFF